MTSPTSQSSSSNTSTPGCPATYDRDGRATPFCRARYLVPPGFKLPRGDTDQPHNSACCHIFHVVLTGGVWGPEDLQDRNRRRRKKGNCTRPRRDPYGRRRRSFQFLRRQQRFTSRASQDRGALPGPIHSLRQRHRREASSPTRRAAPGRANRAAWCPRPPRYVYGPARRREIRRRRWTEHGVEALQQLILNTPALGHRRARR